MSPGSSPVPPAGSSSRWRWPPWRTAARGRRAGTGRSTGRRRPARRASAARRPVPCRAWSAGPPAPAPPPTRPPRGSAARTGPAARAGPARRPRPPGRSRTARGLGVADDLQLDVVRGHRDHLDGPVGGPHAAPDRAALEGRAGRAPPVASSQSPLPSTISQLVPTSMNSRMRLSRSIPEASRPGDDVAADVGAEGREHHGPGPRVRPDAQVGGEDLRVQPGGHDERRDAERLGVDAQGEVRSWWRCRRPRPRRPRSGRPRPARTPTGPARRASREPARSADRARPGPSSSALIRVITSAPNGCCLLSIEATATGVPVDRSSSVATTVVVPRSKAMPNRRPGGVARLDVDQHVVDDHRGDLVVGGAQHPARSQRVQVHPQLEVVDRGQQPLQVGASGRPATARSSST